jgi:methionine biosynthesis protein MetW
MTATVRCDYGVIADMINERARVLDVGCGDGALLELLISKRKAQGRGLELSQAGVNACVAKGLSVVQGDADRDLAMFPDKSFDYVVLSKTIQTVRQPRRVLSELLRIGERAIVSLPNFGHWRARWQIVVSGRMPVTEALPSAWHESDNIHLCTVRDFAALCADLSIAVERAVPIADGEPGAPFSRNLWAPNLFAEDAVFLLKRV